MDKKIKAFSLVEILISLITISLILATFAPVISKRISRSVTVKEVQPVCPQAWQMAVKIDEKYYCFTRFNVGDFVNGIGIDIPLSAKVTVVKPEETCGASSDYETKCCWQGIVSNNCDEATDEYTYGACARTVCNWAAADAICKSLGMELPSSNQLKVIYSDYSIGKGKTGAQFCAGDSGDLALYCAYNKTCKGSYGTCFQNDHWTNESSLEKANFVAVYQTRCNIINRVKSAADSIRCITPYSNL